MKKYIYIIYFVCLLGSGLQAQVLWSDDFDNYTTGNVGTINSFSTSVNLNPNPAVAGQGGWFVIEQYNGTAPYINSFEARIEPEPGRGNVLTLEDIPQTTSASGSIFVSKVIGNEKPEGGIESLWHGRDTGNDILKFEYDLYTGNLGTDVTNSIVNLGKAKNSGFNFPNATDLTYMMGSRYNNLPSSSTIVRELSIAKYFSDAEYVRHGQVSDNTWVTIIMYIDYATGYLYLEVPSMNKTVRSANPVPLIPDTQGRVLEPIDHILIHLVTDPTAGNGSRNPYFCKYDNLKMSAVNTLPLSLKKLAAATFSIFPNPVTDVVTITNSENIGVEQIEVFDISGKIVKTQNFNKENKVHLNIGDFDAGTYLLHIKTNEGTAVEKVVKK